MEISDETIFELKGLLDRANSGDDGAFNDLLIRVESRLRDLTKRMFWQYPRVKRWETTDDVFQKSIIRLHRSLTSAKPDSVRAFIGLAATQVRRTLIDLSRHYYGVLGYGAKHHSEGGGRAADDPGGAIDRTTTEPTSLEDWTEFHEATQKLPVEIKEAFELTWYAGMQQQEVAKLLDVSTRTVIRRLNEARRRLREILVGNSET